MSLRQVWPQQVLQPPRPQQTCPNTGARLHLWMPCMHRRKCWDVMQNKEDSCPGRTRRPEWGLKYSTVTKHSSDRSGLAAESNGARALFLSFGLWGHGGAVLGVLRGLREARGGAGGVSGSNYVPGGTECFDTFTVGTWIHTACSATCAHLMVGYGSFQLKGWCTRLTKAIGSSYAWGRVYQWGIPERRCTDSQVASFSWACLAPGQHQGWIGKAGSTQLAHL